jgi:Mlc titration factor MtfA (ptsG expression regulator)
LLSAWRQLRRRLVKPILLIDEDAWAAATRHYLFMQPLGPEEKRRLRLIASDLLTRKQIIGAAGLEVTETMRIQIAAQACILVLELGIEQFEGWTDIIVYPGQFVPEREVMDEAGVIHTTREVLAGEAWLEGPVILSYEDVVRAGDPLAAVAGHNVVIHEFAHKLDMRNGGANGFPPLPKGMNASIWRQVFMAAYLDFCRRTDEAERLARRDRGAALDALPIDPYASENPAEFFAVISEAFFEIPQNVQKTYPEVYRQLALFYRQDPLQRMALQS